MQMENYTPFPNLRFFGMDNCGREFGVLLVKGTYRVGPDGWLLVAEDQSPLVMTDTYYGELNTSSLRLPSDIVPMKPRSDIIVNAVARSPTGQPSRSWVCGLRIEGEHVVEKRIRVTGPREWHPIWGVSERARASMTNVERRRVLGGWRLSVPEPVSEVPIRYELAYGGRLPRSEVGSDALLFETDERNPIGRGGPGGVDAALDGPVPAPQIEDAADPVLDPFQRYAPAGFGAIPPAWMPRRPLGGTFDEHWKTNVWPDWPEDYSFSYHNSANSNLIYPEFLVGNERIILSGFDRNAPTRLVRLPVQSVMLRIQYDNNTSMIAPMNLDTLLLDFTDRDLTEHRAYVSWRMTFDHKNVVGLVFDLVRWPLASIAGSPDFTHQSAAKRRIF